ncbi:MAG: PEGA domain-containing protein [Ignavibacteria bacterium]|nr:PEGA domain-containing protein [Ignavibacteria bacterium]
MILVACALSITGYIFLPSHSRPLATITVESEPGAALVMIGNKEIGRTPIHRYEIGAGQQRLLVVHAGFTTLDTVLDAQAGASLNVRLKLREQQPSDAETGTTAADGPMQREGLEAKTDKGSGFIGTKSNIDTNALLIDLKTNKGRTNLVFYDGETLKASLRANRDCYIDVMYRFANGKCALLAKNKFLHKSNEYSGILPKRFIVDTPYGKESIRVIASTKMLPQRNTIPKGKFALIPSGDENGTIPMRGLRYSEAGVVKTEKELVVETRAAKKGEFP